MLSAENLSLIESEGRLIARAGRRDPDRRVPQYPGWTLRDLASHTASIHGRTTLICRTLPQERVSAPRLPERARVLDWYEETLEEMIASLRAADPDIVVWAFGSDPCIGFWERRMVIETGVHRWDAEQAFGEEGDLHPRVAEMGLDEFADMWLPQLPAVPVLEVRATDLDRFWSFGEGKPAETVTGNASDLYLRLLSRPSPVELPVSWADAVDGLEPPPKR